jgi:hypothetical protein
MDEEYEIREDEEIILRPAEMELEVARKQIKIHKSSANGTTPPQPPYRRGGYTVTAPLPPQKHKKTISHTSPSPKRSKSRRTQRPKARTAKRTRPTGRWPLNQPFKTVDRGFKRARDSGLRGDELDAKLDHIFSGASSRSTYRKYYMVWGKVSPELVKEWREMKGAYWSEFWSIAQKEAARGPDSSDNESEGTGEEFASADEGGDVSSEEELSVEATPRKKGVGQSTQRERQPGRDRDGSPAQGMSQSLQQFVHSLKDSSDEEGGGNSDIEILAHGPSKHDLHASKKRRISHTGSSIDSFSIDNSSHRRVPSRPITRSPSQTSVISHAKTSENGGKGSDEDELQEDDELQDMSMDNAQEDDGEDEGSSGHAGIFFGKF